MENTKEEERIKKAKEFIWLPLFITVICAWLDMWTNYSSGAYDIQQVEIEVKNIIGLNIENNQVKLLVDLGKNNIYMTAIRCGAGYFFPSVISIVIAMISERINTNDESYGVMKEKVGSSLVATVIYSTLFLTCLIKYNVITATILVVSSIVYVIYIYSCLDEKIRPTLKKDKNQRELLIEHYNENYENPKRGGK